MGILELGTLLFVSLHVIDGKLMRKFDADCLSYCEQNGWG